MNEKPRLHFLLRLVMAASWAMFFGVGVAVGTMLVYVLFWVPPAEVATGSLHSGVPLTEKLAYFGALLAIIWVGYMINRSFWRSVRRAVASR